MLFPLSSKCLTQFLGLRLLRESTPQSLSVSPWKWQSVQSVSQSHSLISVISLCILFGFGWLVVGWLRCVRNFINVYCYKWFALFYDYFYKRIKIVQIDTNNYREDCDTIILGTTTIAIGLDFAIVIILPSVYKALCSHKKKITMILLAFALSLALGPCLAYKPVVLVHGIMTGSGSMEMIQHRIEEVRHLLSAPLYFSPLYIYDWYK